MNNTNVKRIIPRHCLNPHKIVVFNTDFFKDDGSRKRKTVFLKNNYDIDRDHIDPITGEILEVMTIPCGECEFCKRKKSLDWSTRIIMESELYNLDRKCMITLTYDDEHLPLTSDFKPTLRYSDVQKWLKRFRKRITSHYGDNTPVRFVCACEYGGRYQRPHYHIIMFGYKFDRKESNFRYSHDSQSGIPCYVNDDIKETWQNGMHTIQLYDDACASYISQYLLKDVHLKQNDKIYYRV